MSTEPLVEVKGLKKYPLRDGLFGRTSGQLKAVDDVSFSIRKGRAFSGWWASPAAAKPPLAARCLACTTKPPAR